MPRSSWPIAVVAAALLLAFMLPLATSAQDDPALDGSAADVRAQMRLHALAPALARLADEMPGLAAVSVGDLRTGRAIAVNGEANLPAASTIKIPVMVEVFRQSAIGRISLHDWVTLGDGDRDCGYGDLCDAPGGSRYKVIDLVRTMIDDSDNTAANMLIRVVGRQSINHTMTGLGLTQTRLADSIHSDGDVRSLRTSADDMLRLLAMIAARRVVDAWACDRMLAILAAQRHNDLLPQPLPKGTVVAHKTGTLHDTLNDVGIVELAGSPYVICAFATHLSDLDDGERFIRSASLLAFRAFGGSGAGQDGPNARL